MSHIRNLLLSVLLVAAALPVHATFPGKNGRIAFVLGPDIYTMKSDGSDIRQLTHFQSGTGAAFQSWSPDGKQIVFNKFSPPDFRGELWLMNADGSNQHPLFADPDFNDYTASFTPDGASIVFSRCRTDIEACSLYQVGVDGTGLRAITDFDLGILDFWPQYSPHNGSLAFTSLSRGGIIGAIYVNATGSTPLQTTPAALSGEQPDWSPDGTRIALSSHCCNPQNEEIWVKHVEGEGLRRLTKNGDDYPTGSHDFHPSWSPQGDAIVFERDAPDFSSASVFIIGADGNGCRNVAALPTVARPNIPHIKELRGVRGQIPNRHLKQIEEGGALPQWGVASD
jgi:Tol biopolymer transport system component